LIRSCTRSSRPKSLSYLWFVDERGPDVRYAGVTRSFLDDSLYSERDDQRWGCYDGILRVSLNAEALEIHFDKEAERALGGVETIRVDCSGLNEETWERVERVLRSILSDRPVALTIS
jgi:hypothetical protein